jgi:hypothetical protein
MGQCPSDNVAFWESGFNYERFFSVVHQGAR